MQQSNPGSGLLTLLLLGVALAVAVSVVSGFFGGDEADEFGKLSSQMAMEQALYKLRCSAGCQCIDTAFSC